MYMTLLSDIYWHLKQFNPVKLLCINQIIDAFLQTRWRTIFVLQACVSITKLQGFFRRSKHFVIQKSDLLDEKLKFRQKEMHT